MKQLPLWLVEKELLLHQLPSWPHSTSKPNKDKKDKSVTAPEVLIGQWQVEPDREGDKQCTSQRDSSVTKRERQTERQTERQPEWQ